MSAEYQPQLLEICRFGNPILRATAGRVARSAIAGNEIQQLIANIRHTNAEKKAGVGLAAPQVGVSLALSVIGIKPTPNRPNLEPFEQVIINPTYTGIGEKEGMWEACQSGGEGVNSLYAQAMRYTAIHAAWTDEFGKDHEKTVDGFVAHVFQHETDHLNGVLFVDRVEDTTTYMTSDEFKKRIIDGKT